MDPGGLDRRSASFQDRAPILRLPADERETITREWTGSMTMKAIGTTPIIASAIATAVAAVALFSTGAASADSRLRQNEVRQLRESGKILPMEDILARVRNLQPGQVVEIELDHEKGAYVYEVKVIDDKDKIHKLELDAGNGEVLRRKEK
jgi:uncharacterized membrane protein YkoI